MKKELLLITLTLLIITSILAQDLNQTQTQELYTENAYGVFYIIIIAILLAITILALTLIMPRIKEYT